MTRGIFVYRFAPLPSRGIHSGTGRRGSVWTDSNNVHHPQSCVSVCSLDVRGARGFAQHLR